MISLILAASMAMSLPDDFDPKAHMIARHTEAGVLHDTRDSASLARRLVAEGGKPRIELAETILGQVLKAQERHEGDPHLGNFRWYLEDPMVEDLNSVEFVLGALIPMMLENGDRLSPETRQQLLDSIRLGLAEIARLDVLPAYTNITAKDIMNTILGGELLGDVDIAERGYRKLATWIAFTEQFGTTFEFNSPTYTRVTINALAELIRHVDNPQARVRARAMATRLGLSVALHIHPGTGRWAGPHSRAYQPTVVAETPPEIADLEQWVSDDVLPAWLLEAAVKHRPTDIQITETAFPPNNLGLTTWMGANFDLGTAVTGMDPQSDVMIAHYARPGAERVGVFYTRYLRNDKWFGDFYHETDRSSSRNLLDEGKFYGVQSGPRAIGVYTPTGNPAMSSAKAALIWTGADLIDEIRIGGKPVSALPADVPPGALVVIASGTIFQAVKPLTVTDLGRDAPRRLVRRGNDLVLELYNYLGPKKHFWELDWPGGFYQGKPQAGFFTEVAERSRFEDAAAFEATIDSGTFTDETAPAFVYGGQGTRDWKLGYTRGDVSLGMDVDLMAFKLKRRWDQEGDMGWPMLESPVARANRSGLVEVGGATLRVTKGQPAWLYANPGQDIFVAGYNGLEPSRIELALPGDRDQIVREAMGMGVIVREHGKVIVDAVD